MSAMMQPLIQEGSVAEGLGVVSDATEDRKISTQISEVTVRLKLDGFGPNFSSLMPNLIYHHDEGPRHRRSPGISRRRAFCGATPFWNNVPSL